MKKRAPVITAAARDRAQLVGALCQRWSIIADFGLVDDGQSAFVVRRWLAGWNALSSQTCSPPWNCGHRAACFFPTA